MGWKTVQSARRRRRRADRPPARPPLKRASAALIPCFIAQRYIQRFSGLVSSAMTCTSDTMFSHMRGGDIMKAGPISRMSLRTVAVSSGKLTVKPASIALATPTICSPIHARGRNETNSSPGSIGSTPQSWAAIARRLACDSIASLGTLVVPEVVQSSAMSSGRTSASLLSNSMGNLSRNLSPRPSTSSNAIKPGASYPYIPRGS